MVFDGLARRPLIAMASSSDTLRISARADICPASSPADSRALVFDYLPYFIIEFIGGEQA